MRGVVIEVTRWECRGHWDYAAERYERPAPGLEREVADRPVWVTDERVPVAIAEAVFLPGLIAEPTDETIEEMRRLRRLGERIEPTACAWDLLERTGPGVDDYAVVATISEPDLLCIEETVDDRRGPVITISAAQAAGLPLEKHDEVTPRGAL